MAQLATDPDDIDVLADGGATLDVNYIFVQTETATSFPTSKVGQIEYGVKDFFASEPTLARNEAVTAAAEVSAQILKHARLFRNGNPSCTVYYATAGRWRRVELVSVEGTSTPLPGDRNVLPNARWPVKPMESRARRASAAGAIG